MQKYIDTEIMKDRTEPVMVFKNDRELNECVKWWQSKLFLNNWWIVAHLVDSKEIPNHAGENHFVHETHSSVINVAKLTEQQRKDGIVKSCDEETVVHELLHLKYNLVGFDDDNCSYEQCYLDMNEHALLEEMAKSLISVKYDLPQEWWYNSD